MTGRNTVVDKEMAEARSLARRGQLESAKRLYNRILARNPRNKKAKIALKRLQNRNAGAAGLPEEKDFLGVVGLLSQGRLESALSEATRLCEKFPDQPALHNLLGVTYARLGQWELAVECYRRALEQAPGFTDALNNMGAAYAQAREYDRAVSCYRESLRISPNDPGVQYNLGNALRAIGDGDSALKAYSLALKYRPDFGDAANNLASLYAEVGDFEQAANSYLIALEINPDMPNVRKSLADAYFAAGRLEDAVKCYGAVLSEDPESEHAQMRQAAALFSLQRYDAAASAYERLVKHHPQHAAWANHVVAAARRDRSDRAPPEYAERLFNEYAERFDEHLLQGLEYSAPSFLRHLLLTTPGGAGPYPEVLDVGCGTGLAGKAFRDIAGILTGIDVAEKMVDQARKKGIYDAIHVGDAAVCLDSLGSAYHLVICADMLPYVGELTALFKSFSRHMVSGGKLLCSTEHCDGEGFVLRQTGRFAHSMEYIVRIGALVGLELSGFQTKGLRKEGGNWIIGGMYCLIKRG
jgi:predicted TPR repeat methyltransferase